MNYVFEVKAPSLLMHQRARTMNPLQLPGRVFREAAERLTGAAGGGNVTLPRDNPVKDFLISSEAKFAPFKAAGPCRTYLVIVWDNFIYEPITSLVSDHSGLFTPASFALDKHGKRLTFPSVDAVIIIRHLVYFQNAAGDRPLVDRIHAFDFGGPHALPNVFVPVPGGQVGPDFISEGLRAVPWNDPLLQHFADYRSQEFIMWT
jgi:hypothetical protein